MDTGSSICIEPDGRSIKLKIYDDNISMFIFITNLYN